MTRRRKVLFVLMTIGLALIVICGVLEVGLRVFGVTPSSISPLKDFHRPDAVVGFRGRPNLDARWTRPEFTVRIVHDERGHRAHRQGPPENAEADVHVFGDSFTWGWGVDHGEVFTDRLAGLRPDRRVVNYGINGTGTATHYRLFRDECHADLRAGDAVVVAFYTNDFADCFDDRQVHVKADANGTFELLPAARHRKWENWETWLKKRSALYSWIAHQIAWRVQAKRNREARGVVPMLLGSDLGERYFKAVKHCLRLFRDDCRAKGARFFVLSIPEMAEMDSDADPIPARKALAEICRSLEIPLVDPTQALRRLNAKEPAYIHADGHWTAAGHDEVARVLYEALRK